MKASNYNCFFPTKDKDVFLLYNTLYGSLFVVDNEIKTLLESNRLNEIHEDILETYKKEGIVIEDGLDEKEIIKVKQDKEKFENLVTSITLLTTYNCNLRCIYCYEGAGERLNADMDEDTAERVIEFIKKQTVKNRSKYLSILFYGGEPLMTFETAKNVLSELYPWAKDKDIKFTTAIVTNGTLLKKSHLDYLSKFNLGYIQITLDGPKEYHDVRRIKKNGSGTYDRIIKSIKMVQEYESIPNPLIRINIDSQNAKSIPDLFDDLKEEGLNKSRIDLGILKNITPACASFSTCLSGEEISVVIPQLWKEAMKRGFYPNLRPRQAYVFCGSLRESYYTIDPEGNLFKCWEHVGIEEHKMGIIQENGIVKSISPRYFEWMSRDALEIQECRECKLLPACGGGCAAIAYAKEGTYKASGCFRIKYLIEEQLKLYLESKYPEKFASGKYIGKWDFSF